MRPLQFTKREMQEGTTVNFAKTALKNIAIIAGIAGVFAFLGVYNTNEYPPLFRFLFWAATIATGSLTSIIIVPLVWDKFLTPFHISLKIIAAAAIISIPVTFVMLALLGQLTRTSPAYWAVSALYVFIISLVLTTFMALAQTRTAKKTETQQANPTYSLLSRLPRKYREATLYAVTSEDHYLRVHTDLGQELILMRLVDAIKELSETPGIQTHRSWWVALDGVADSRREKDKALLILKSGAEAPVSRGRLQATKAAGLL